MGEVRRFRAWWNVPGENDCLWAKDGDVVLATDYDALLADARRLRDALQQHMLIADIFPDWVADLLAATAYLEETP